mmetsp:Transcript_1024/g.793  ORF Transcript_1024/g.793 Transcript_1024/m.793 type:complete len:281 (-) Transcript_1024:21-863(-)
MVNIIKTTILLAILTSFFLLIGYIIGGQQGMVIAFVLAVGMNFFSYWFSDKVVLKMYKAQAVTLTEEPKLYDMVKILSQNARLPMPRVFIIPEESPNAFATGRNPEHAVIAVTKGLLNIMDKEEIMGVLSHELAHVKNRDILIGSIAATIAGAIMMFASMARWSAIFSGGGSSDEEEGGSGIIGLIIISVLAPIAALLIQMAISRSREYLADQIGSRFARNSKGLARALEKLGMYSGRLPMNANPSTAHMFIVNPLSSQSLMNLFSTHPPLEKRITRLQK